MKMIIGFVVFLVPVVAYSQCGDIVLSQAMYLSEQQADGTIPAVFHSDVSGGDPCNIDLSQTVYGPGGALDYIVADPTIDYSSIDDWIILDGTVLAGDYYADAESSAEGGAPSHGLGPFLRVALGDQYYQLLQQYAGGATYRTCTPYLQCSMLTNVPAYVFPGGTYPYYALIFVGKLTTGFIYRSSRCAALSGTPADFCVPGMDPNPLGP